MKPGLALLHYTAHPVHGGVEAVMEEHRRLLSEHGYRVKVIAARGEAELVPLVDSRHRDVERLYLGLARGENCDSLFNELRARIGEALRPHLAGVDLVVAHNVMTMPFNLPLAAALPHLGPRLIAWTHAVAWVNPRYRAYHRDGAPYDLLHKPASAQYVAISTQRQAEIANAYGIESEVVPDGIDSARLLRLRPSTVDLLRRAGVWDANPLVLVPFRITRRKRLEDALEVAARLAPSRPGLKWVVSGPLGPHQADNVDYANRLAEQRRRLGLEATFAFLHEQGQPGRHPVDDEMMAELYSLAGAVFLPSESEGFGLPVAEAGLHRVPVVATDLAVFREVAGDLIRRYPVGDVEAAAAALSAALQGSEAALQARVRGGYTWSALFPKIEAVISRALD